MWLTGHEVHEVPICGSSHTTSVKLWSMDSSGTGTEPFCEHVGPSRKRLKNRLLSSTGEHPQSHSENDL